MLRLFALIFVALLLGRQTLAAPDIVVVLVDDLGAAVIGPERRTVTSPTPNIDALAVAGTTYSQAYSAPICVPSRAMLLSGRWPYRNSMGAIWSNGPNPPRSVVMLPEHLRAHGYATELVGKWGLGFNPGKHPLDQGFDHFFGFANATPNYFGDDPDAPLWRDRTRIKNSGYVTDTLAAEAVRILQSIRTKPLFLYIPLTATHDPLQTSLAVAVQGVDRALGRVVAAAKPDTLFVFAGDNGRRGNAPLRGGKYSIWEGGVRVPFILRWTGRIGAGAQSATPVSLLDVVPTVLAAAGAPIVESLDGLNLLGVVPAEREIYFGAYRRRGSAVRAGRWKLYRDYEGMPVRLYDVLADKAEKTNLAGTNPDVVRSMSAALDRWLGVIND